MESNQGRAELLTKGLIWRIGTGEKTSFWQDSCAPCGKLINFDINLQNVDPQTVDANLISLSGWNAQLLGNLVLAVHSIAPLPTFLHNSELDMLIWSGTLSGVYSVTSAMKLLQVSCTFWQSSMYGNGHCANDSCLHMARALRKDC